MQFFKILFLLFIFAVCMAIYSVFFVYRYYNRPIITEDKFFIVNHGDSYNKILLNLFDEKIVIGNNKFFFMNIARIYRLKSSGFKSGEYLFKKGISLLDMLKQMQYGKTHSRKITFAEGLTNDAIFEIINNAEGLVGDLPSVDDVLEGTLLPETYTYQRGDTKKSLINRMQKAMVEFFDKEWEKRELNLPFKTKQEALNLASIVEKETGLPEERGKVASVFINRLRKKMRLQSDPTVAYAFTHGKKSLEREIRKSDLEDVNEYNTYKINGIPQKPISNPGKDSIKATLNPEKTDYLYFVATGSGGHRFTKELSDHNKAVRDYRKIIKEK
ncbi:MAG: endolytic transglycosylase MltG [Rickettsiales bacterium]|jgi:UPF0755 protein|nr:endolytic transglycosylase MltG [Rickettsiales bacterium]